MIQGEINIPFFLYNWMYQINFNIVIFPDQIFKEISHLT